MAAAARPAARKRNAAVVIAAAVIAAAPVKRAEIDRDDAPRRPPDWIPARRAATVVMPRAASMSTRPAATQYPEIP